MDIHFIEIKERDAKKLCTVCEYAEREKAREKSMGSNVSVIRSEAEVHYETPLRLYL